MGISALRSPVVAALACVLGLSSMETFTREVAALDTVQAEQATADHRTAEEPGHPLAEMFMVIDHGCALLGPDGQEKERLESITNAAGAISPNGRWAAFSKSDPNPPPGKGQGKLVIQSRVRREERTTVPMVWGTTGSSFLPI